MSTFTSKEEGNIITILVVLIAVVAIAGVFLLGKDAESPAASTTQNSESDMDMLSESADSDMGETRMAGDAELADMSDEDMAADGGGDEVSLPEVDDEVIVSTPAPSVSGSFEAYAEDKLALAETGEVIIYFTADWCPSCRALNKDIEENLSDIPDNVHILTLDYDTETALKQKYGITRQHTLIRVDASGTKIGTLNGLNNTLANVVSQL